MAQDIVKAIAEGYSNGYRDGYEAAKREYEGNVISGDERVSKTATTPEEQAEIDRQSKAKHRYMKSIENLCNYSGVEQKKLEDVNG